MTVAGVDTPGPQGPVLAGEPTEPLGSEDRRRYTGEAGRALHTAALVTPEGVLLEFRMAGIGSRLIARVIDLILQFIGFIALTFLGIFTAFGSELLSVVILLVGVFLIVFGYPALMETFGGRTVGKMAMSLRVVTTEGRPVGFAGAATRSIIGFLEFLVSTGLVPLLAALLTRRGQRIGDLAAGTIVIRETRDRAFPIEFPMVAGWERYGLSLDVRALGPQQYGLIRETLLRVRDLNPDAQVRLTSALAADVARTIHHSPPGHLDPVLFLTAVASAYQRRFRQPSAGPSPGRMPPPPGAGAATVGRPPGGPQPPPPPTGSRRR